MTRTPPAPGRPRGTTARRWRTAVPVVAALGVALALAGCSSGSPSASRSTTTTGARSTTTTSTGTSTTSGGATTTTSAGGATTTTGSGVATCLASQLAIVPQQGSAAAGTVYQTFTLTNVSAGTCTLAGYPGMQLLASSGTAIPTTVVRGGLGGGAPSAAGQPPATVTLAPQQAAAFSAEYEDVPVATETSCPTSAKAEITPPNDTTPAVVSVQMDPCDNGTVHVSPVYATS